MGSMFSQEITKTDWPHSVMTSSCSLCAPWLGLPQAGKKDAADRARNTLKTRKRKRMLDFFWKYSALLSQRCFDPKKKSKLENICHSSNGCNILKPKHEVYRRFPVAGHSLAFRACHSKRMKKDCYQKMVLHLGRHLKDAVTVWLLNLLTHVSCKAETFRV